MRPLKTEDERSPNGDPDAGPERSTSTQNLRDLAARDADHHFVKQVIIFT